MAMSPYLPCESCVGMHVSHVRMVNTAISHGCVMPMVMRIGEGGVACQTG